MTFVRLLLQRGAKTEALELLLRGAQLVALRLKALPKGEPVASKHVLGVGVQGDCVPRQPVARGWVGGGQPFAPRPGG